MSRVPDVLERYLKEGVNFKQQNIGREVGLETVL